MTGAPTTRIDNPIRRAIPDLRGILDRLAELYDPRETRVWLQSRHPLLNRHRAIDLMRAGRANDVLAVIESLNEGSHT